MKHLAGISMLFSLSHCFCQKRLPRNNLEYYFSNLNNYSVQVSKHYAPTLVLDSTAQFLYMNANRYVLNKLINFLEDENKTVACHVLLSKLLLTNTSIFRSSESEDSSGNLTYKYNNFIWKEIMPKSISGTVKIEFDAAQIPKFVVYWNDMRSSGIYKLRSTE